MKTKHFLLCVFALLFSIVAVAQTTYFVKPGGGGNQDGCSWENAKATIADALNVASSGNQIFVAQGTYILTAIIEPKNGVNVYGGFKGTESSLAERPKLIYGQTATGEASVLDANGSSSVARRVIGQSAAFTVETIWDGFIMKNGYVAQDGGAVVLHANGKLNNCTITNNVAGRYGGGVFCDGASVVTNCRIINNKALNGGGISASRDGIDTGGSSISTIVNCLITNNTATAEGGGILSQFANITNCTIVNNKANNGGGILAYSNRPIVTNCIVWGNLKAENIYTGGQINGAGDGNTNSASSYFATQGTYGGGGTNMMTLDAANTGNGNSNYPAFKNPNTIRGYVTNEEDIAAIFAADWSLTDASACKDAGTPDVSSLNLPSLDLNGKPRISNSRIDMGAYEVPTDLVIEAGTTVSYSDYKTGGYSDIIIESNETSTGQLILGEEVAPAVNGVVKLEKTFNTKVWYPLGFPFEPAHVTGIFPSTMNIPPDYDLAVYNGTNYGDFWVKSFDGAFFDYSTKIEANTGYIFQFPEAFNGVKVTFTSGADIPLENTDLPDNDELQENYNLILNCSFANLQTTGDARFYLYNSANNSFEPAEAKELINPFEAFILAKTSAPQVQSISVNGEITGLKNTITPAGNDPVIATHYYTLQGEEIQRPLKDGIYIVKKIHASQNAEVSKEFHHK
jgi:hypothetical protein